MVFNNAYEVLEYLMNTSKDGNTSMWGLIRLELERLKVENETLKATNTQLESDQLQTLEAIAEVYETLLGGM